jgi:hypothetical protein
MGGEKSGKKNEGRLPFNRRTGRGGLGGHRGARKHCSWPEFVAQISQSFIRMRRGKGEGEALTFEGTSSLLC